MAEKKHIQSKSAKPNSSSTTVPAKPVSAKKTGADPSFWKRLLEDKPRLYLYQKICVFLVAFFVFANGIPNGFNMDDNYYTTKENHISDKGIKAIPRIFTTHTFYDNGNNSFEYRPVAMLSFALQHQLLGSSAAVSHFINVVIYASICLLVFVLLCYWFGVSASWFAFFVTLIYAVHPLHTEVVDSIKNRDELLATFFAMLSMISIWKWHKTGKTLHLILCVFLFLIGLLCKRTIITYIAVIPIAFYFFTDMPVRKIVLPSIILFVSFFITFRCVNRFLLHGTKRVFLFFENPMHTTHTAFGIKTATSSYILGWYSYLHVLPYPLSFYYGYKYVRLMHWNSFLPVLSLVIYLLLALLVVKNIRKKSLIAFGALLYLTCILPYSNLFAPAPGMMADRFTFSSSLGYCILLISVLYYLYKIIPGASVINKNSKYLVATCAFIFISYTAMSINRNTEWENNFVLFSNDIQHLQSSVKANMLYGEQVLTMTNRLRQEFDAAPGMEKQLYRDSLLQYLQEEKIPFQRALAVAPDYSKALNNIAIAYIHDDSFVMAKTYLQRAIALTPNDADNTNAHYNLGVVFGNISMRDNKDNFLDSAAYEFKKVIGLNAHYPLGYRMLSNIYMKQKDTTSALHVLLLGIQNVPDMSFLYIETAKLYLLKKDTAQAIYYDEQGAEVSRPDPMLLQMLQGYYHDKNNLQKESYYRNKMNAVNTDANHGN